MIHPKSNPIGIDKVIDRIQKLIHDPLETDWGNIDVYGRVYKVEKDNKIELQRYIGNGDYENILFNEGNKVFFVQGDSLDINLGNVNNELWLIAVMKIDSNTIRTDEEAHETVLTSLSTNFLKNVVAIEYGMANLRRIVEDSFTGNFKYSDIHPYHVFMVKMNVEYSLIKDNC